MKNVFNSDHRHMIPRWNSIENALNQHELSSNIVTNPDEVKKLKESQWEYYEQCVEAWNIEKTVPTAVDLISQAAMLDIECLEPVDFIKTKIIKNEFIPTAVKELVGESIERPSLNGQEKIKELRKKLSNVPKDSFLWSELARNYLIAGEVNKAEKALFTAYNLTPNNRYILRNISRFYMHKDDCEKALYYVRNCQALLKDPWILSAEIALSNLCDRTSRNIKVAKNIIEGNNNTFESISELASELGTMEYENANKKAGKRNLLVAKKAINENAAAQIQWINNEVNRLDEEILRYGSPANNFEGEIYKKLVGNGCDWNEMLVLTKKWHGYQPFSADPILWASVVASDMLNDPETGIKMVEMGLKCNKEDTSLINNLAYCYIQNGNLDAAREQLSKINDSVLEPSNVVLINATRGLLAYREGENELGSWFYQTSMETAKKNNLNSLYTSTLLYYAKEAVNQNEDLTLVSQLLKKCNFGEDLFTKDFIKKYKIPVD